MRSCPATCRAAELVHDPVPVTLEDRHECLHPADRAAVLGRGQQRDDPAFVERVAAAAQLVGGPRHRGHDLARIGVDAPEDAVDESEEVLAHPRDTEELGAVRHLVDRDPQPEVARPEREALLEREHVGADVVDGVTFGLTVARRVAFGHQHVVLAEDALREPAEQQPELRRAHGPTDRRERAGSHALAHAVRERTEQAAHRPDVRLHPVLPVQHGGMRGARDVQAGVLAHHGFGLRGDGSEVVDERRAEVRAREGVVAGDATGDSRGEGPVDGLGERAGRVGGRRGRRHSTRLPRYLGISTLRT